MWSLKQSSSTCCYKVILPEHLEEFRQWTIKNAPNVKFEVDLHDKNCWAKRELISRDCTGPSIYSDNGPQDGQAILVTYNDNLRLSFSVPGNHKIQLQLTRSENPWAEPNGECVVIEDLETTEYSSKRGLYKLPGFDKAFQAMKEMKPELTELSFGGFVTYEDNFSYDEDLLDEREYTDDTDCIHIVTRNGYKTKLLGTWITKIWLAVSELPQNLDKIKTLLIEDDSLKNYYQVYIIYGDGDSSTTYNHLGTRMTLGSCRALIKENLPPKSCKMDLVSSDMNEGNDYTIIDKKDGSHRSVCCSSFGGFLIEIQPFIA